MAKKSNMDIASCFVAIASMIGTAVTIPHPVASVVVGIGTIAFNFCYNYMKDGSMLTEDIPDSYKNDMKDVLYKTYDSYINECLTPTEKLLLMDTRDRLICNFKNNLKDADKLSYNTQKNEKDKSNFNNMPSSQLNSSLEMVLKETAIRENLQIDRITLRMFAIKIQHEFLLELSQKPELSSYVNRRLIDVLFTEIELLKKEKKEKEDLIKPFRLFDINTSYNVFKTYYAKQKKFYFELDKVNKLIEDLTEHKSVIIRGKQGSGKTIYAFNIAEKLQKRAIVEKTYYLDLKDSWNTTIAQIERIQHYQKSKRKLWIIDNIHRQFDFENDIEIIYDGICEDLFIFLTRNTQKQNIENKNPNYLQYGVKNEALLNIDNDYFHNIISLHHNKINREHSNKIFILCCSDLKLFDVIMEVYPDVVYTENISMQPILQKVYERYFSSISMHSGNLKDILDMLLLSQMDYSIPLILQNQSVNNELKSFFDYDNKGNASIEHTTIAEILFASICYKFNLDLAENIKMCLKRSVNHILNFFNSSLLDIQTSAEWINKFVVRSYDFGTGKSSVTPNLNRKIIIELKCYHKLLLCLNGVISCDSWKFILVDNNEESKSFMIDLFTNALESGAFINAMCVNKDFTFGFIKNYVSEDYIILFEDNFIKNYDKINNIIMSEPNEKQFMNVLNSLTDGGCSKWIDTTKAYDIYNIMLNSNIYAYYFSIIIIRLSNENKTKIETKLLEKKDYVSEIATRTLNITSAAFWFGNCTGKFRNYLVEILILNAKTIIERTITNNASIGTFDLSLRALGKQSAELLESFEEIIGVDQYIRLIDKIGTLPILAQILRYSSPNMSKNLIDELKKQQQVITNIVTSAIKNNASIGTFDLSLRALGKQSAELLESFEEIIGVDQYIRLIDKIGTLPILTRILQYSSPNMSKNLIGELKKQQQVITNIVTSAIKNNASIGTFNLSLRDLGKQSAELLESFEEIIGVDQYIRLIDKMGTLPILAQILRYSSPNMSKNLIGELKKQQQVITNIVTRTIKNNASIGTFNLSLRDLGKQSAELLESFEEIIGVDQYIRLIDKMGTLPILAQILRYSSPNMSKNLIGELKKQQQVITNIVTRTIKNNASIGTFNLSLRDLGKQSAELLESFEEIIGVDQYIRLIDKMGTLPILAQILRYSSPNMSKNLIGELKKQQQVITNIVTRTIKNNASIGTFNLSLRDLGKQSAELLESFEEIIGVDQYIKLIDKMGTLPILARILRYSSPNMSKNLIDELKKQQQVITNIVTSAIKNNASIGTFDLSLRALGKQSAELLESFEEIIGVDQYIKLIDKMGTLPILALILRDSSPNMSKNLIGELKKQQQVITNIVTSTIKNNASIGTFNLSLRDLGKQSAELLESFEEIIGVDNYIVVITERGNLPIFICIFANSSKRMCELLIEIMKKNTSLIKYLIKKTEENIKLINYCGQSLYTIRIKYYEQINFLENEIGASGYLNIVKDNCTLQGLGSIISGSTIKMAHEILLRINPIIMDNCTKNQIEDDEQTNKYYKTLNYLRYKGLLEKFENLIGIDRYLKFFQSPNLSDAAKCCILASSSLSRELTKVVIIDTTKNFKKDKKSKREYADIIKKAQIYGNLEFLPQLFIDAYKNN